ARRLATDGLQPDSRGPAADHSHGWRFAACAPRVGAGCREHVAARAAPAAQVVEPVMRIRSFPSLLVIAACAVLLDPDPVHAAHRSRVSADLADHLAQGSQTIDSIVHGDQASIDAVVTRYNLRVKRVLKSGAVLQVTAGQLDALSQDDSIDHLSGDL